MSGCEDLPQTHHLTNKSKVEFFTNGENKMERILEMWLNPINLGVLFLCVTAGIWILAHSAPETKEK